MKMTYVRLNGDTWEAHEEGFKELFGCEWVPTAFTSKMPLSMVINELEAVGNHVLVSQ